MLFKDSLIKLNSIASTDQKFTQRENKINCIDLTVLASSSHKKMYVFAIGALVFEKDDTTEIK